MTLHELSRNYCFHEDELLTLVYEPELHRLTATLLHEEEAETQTRALHFCDVTDYYVVEYSDTSTQKKRHSNSIQHADDAYTFILSSSIENSYLRLFCETTEYGDCYYRDIYICASEVSCGVSTCPASLP